MYKIGLTGGIACGKSTVCSFLRQAGAAVIDTDQIAHSLSLPGEILWQAYVDHFGKIIINNDKSLNRRMIGNIVFADNKEKKWINDTSHPLIMNEVKRQMEELEGNKEKIAVIDVPLLFETGWDKFVDEKWVVYINKRVQIERLRRRNGYSFAEAKRRIKAQMPLKYKMERADQVIDTSHGIETNKKRVFRLWFSLLKRLENG
ncbi:dephospho-CoA kinase [Pectinatus haikarae]|uniref:Dephospho-CoA kinase n=1 Tax=Pectinatus haikarae TaxID=349096 RepID=A0ABT9Y636_9FIRM|nr:dephospho-CoA kinase [Pectinatus haikarae]MDQ0203301.1 dephospho-CoA kinase [Pectinatus haikarae]